MNLMRKDHPRKKADSGILNPFSAQFDLFPFGFPVFQGNMVKMHRKRFRSKDFVLEQGRFEENESPKNGLAFCHVLSHSCFENFSSSHRAQTAQTSICTESGVSTDSRKSASKRAKPHFLHTLIFGCFFLEPAETRLRFLLFGLCGPN